MTNPWVKLWLAGIFAIFSGLCSSPLLAQQATVTHDVVLHRDPSAKSRKIDILPAGARLTLVEANPDSGYYHVQTENDQIGWVSKRFITIKNVKKPTKPNSGNPTGNPTSGTSGNPTTSNPSSVTGTTTTPDGCDASINDHVYHSNRLIVKQDCITVTGTIVDATGGKQPDGVRHEADGDTHGWLAVDDKSLLNSGNINDESGNLVFEIICRFPVTQADAITACQNYTDHVQLPPVGSRVKIVGRYVQDTFHGQWMEIHPVASITVIP